MSPVRTARRFGWLVTVGLIAACGGTSAVRWGQLRGARVTVAAPGLPPPGGLPRTTVFGDGQLTKVQTALNANHISQRASSKANNGCAGGYTVAVTITERKSSRVQMSAYRCANTTFGNIGGDLPGFLAAIGVSAP